MLSTFGHFPLTITQLIKHAATVNACSTVTTSEPDRLRVVTFAELVSRAARLAAGLTSLGVGRGTRVAAYMWNCQEHLEAYLAVPGMGAVLHMVNVRMTDDQLVYVLDDADDQVVIVDESLVATFARIIPRLRRRPVVLVTGVQSDHHIPLGSPALSYEALLGSSLVDFDWPDVDEDSPAAMCHTSGTTGDPKGVVYSHRSTVLHTMSVCSGNGVGMSAADRVLVLVPMFHANAWGWPYAAMMSGAELVFTGRDLSPSHVAETIARFGVTVTGGVPTLWNDLLHGASGPTVDLSSLRLILCGGSAVPASLISAYRERFGVPVVQAWGMTEVSPLGAVARPMIGRPDDATVDSAQGRLLFGIEARLVDDDGRVMPWDGVSQGELQMRGPWVTSGYHGDVSPDSFVDGWLRTGDVGTLDQRGYLRLADRSKDVIKSGGEWISSVLLENLLAEHPELVEATVIGVPDDRWGERPLAVVVAHAGRRPEARELHSWLSERTTKWWTPERWAFVSGVPRTSVGKFDKKLLRRMYAEAQLEVEIVSVERVDAVVDR